MDYTYTYLSIQRKRDREKDLQEVAGNIIKTNLAIFPFKNFLVQFFYFKAQKFLLTNAY